jgi:hypothetical protein
MEATHSSETLVLRRPTRLHIPEDGILHEEKEFGMSVVSSIFDRLSEDNVEI